MGNILASEKFRHFFQGIDCYSKSIDVYSARITDCMTGVAKELFIGKLTATLEASSTPVLPPASDPEKWLYVSPDGFGDDHETCVYSMDDGSKAIFSAWVESGHEWTDDEREEVRFICETLFVFMGRARLSDIASRSLFIDSLTGIPNSAQFVMDGARLARLDELKNYFALYISLRNFKALNTSVGMKHGDEIIKIYAHLLLNRVGSKGFAARLGGDNFAVLIRKTDADEFIKFVSNISIDLLIGGLTSSFRIHSYIGGYDIGEGDNMHYVMNCLSTAIKEAKSKMSENVVIYNSDIMKKLIADEETLSEFPDALKNGEFLVYYQPKVNLENNVMCGCEALVRWNRDGKLVPPLSFIPLFEKSGCICALDFYVLKTVCKNISEWIKEGIEPVRVSVNFSKVHLCNKNVAHDILNIIDEYGVDKKYIEIELTEMSDFNDFQAFKALISELKDNGIMTSIDDFGTGYSSLNLLTNFNFDIVKLDKSFIDNIVSGKRKTDEIVVRSIADMLRELNMKIIAEGVETEEQAKLLLGINITMAQGYLYDKPLRLEEFSQRLKNKQYEKII